MEELLAFPETIFWLPTGKSISKWQIFYLVTCPIDTFCIKKLIFTDSNLKNIGRAFAVNAEKGWLHSKSQKNLIS
jgi:hypothetical protein